jgi:hypothetical protein
VTLGKLLLALIGLNGATAITGTIWAHVDVWAPVANTALLIVLAEMQRRTGRKVDDAHDSIHATARTAASAAECAEAAARITKELGGTLRGGTLPTTPPLEPPA